MDNELLERRRQLESGFATENWSRLNYQQRLELCRELENNYAAERGVAPCYITAEEMEDGTYGYQSGRSIVLNSHVLEDGTFHVTLRDENDQPLLGEDGRPVEKAVPIPAANWAVMETVYHEGTHGVQEAQGSAGPWTLSGPMRRKAGNAISTARLTSSPRQRILFSRIWTTPRSATTTQISSRRSISSSLTGITA